MEQLVFDLAPPEPPSFANFLPGRNAEVLAALARFAAGDATTTGILLWGVAGAGKTHLLRACVAAAASRGAAATYVADPGALAATDADVLSERALVAVDALDDAAPDAQARLFTLFNLLQAEGRHLVGASRAPLASLGLREDLRSRLGWGLVHEVLPLADDDKPAALAAYARSRGFAIPDDAIRYLLAHGRRDMPTLVGALAALDRHSLAQQRPITVPMIRDWLQRDVGLR
ncbi:MAG TPA: DnaA regulatory inactivator Hda [Casimicrobiaceae bacterium]|jgi:DnaA family protein|nr:DnaA regulatory inactivator Hda [Casimicrobiaceae bacterium]